MSGPIDDLQLTTHLDDPETRLCVEAQDLASSRFIISEIGGIQPKIWHNWPSLDILVPMQSASDGDSASTSVFRLLVEDQDCHTERFRPHLFRGRDHPNCPQVSGTKEVP